jgi:hypothetical protein
MLHISCFFITLQCDFLNKRNVKNETGKIKQSLFSVRI